MKTIPKFIFPIVKLLNCYQGIEIFSNFESSKFFFLENITNTYRYVQFSWTIRNQRCRCVSCEHILRYSQEQVKCLVGSWPAIKLRDLSSLICLQLRIKMVQHKALATLNAHKQYLILLHYLPFSTFWLWCITIY